jgi:nucleoid-associated protein YgaU
MPGPPGNEIVNSSTDPTQEELNNDQSNEAKVDEAISNAGGGETANLVQANAAAYSEAITVRVIMQLNNLTNPNLITGGQKLTIPGA